MMKPLQLIFLISLVVRRQEVFIEARYSNARGGASNKGAARPKNKQTTSEDTDGKKKIPLQTLFASVSRQTAAPFLRKTKENVKVASQTVVEFKEKAAHAKERFDLEQQCKEVERQALHHRTRADSLMLESDTIFEKRHKSLGSPDTLLPSSEARRLLDSFLTLDKKVTGVVSSPIDSLVQKEIKALEKEELQAKSKQWQVKEAERRVLAAQRNVEAAKNAEQMALQRLDDARRNLVQATRNIESSEQEKEDMESKEAIAVSENDYAHDALDRQRERVRAGLLKKETESLLGEAAMLKSQAADEEKEAKAFEKEGQDLRSQLQRMIAEHRRLGYCN